MKHLPETLTNTHYTTARIIHKQEDTEGKQDWLWVNYRRAHDFDSAEGAETIANLANANGRDSGLDIDNYPYFVVRVTTTSLVERVEL